MNKESMINETEKIHIDTSVKIGNYDMKFKATGYQGVSNSLFSVIIYDRLYELSGIRDTESDTSYTWRFTTENLLPEDLATMIGREIEKLAVTA